MAIEAGLRQTDIGLVPTDWQVEPLGKVVRLQSGYSFKSDKFSDSGVPVVRISNIQDGIVDISRAICHPPIKIDQRFLVREGDTLVAMSGATTGKVGMYRDRVVAYQNQRVGRFVTRADENVTSAYIRHLVGSTLFSAKLKVYLEQGAQPNISGRQIESLVFQFPRSRVEQQAIATALSDADAYIESLEQLITKKRQIKQGVMQELLTEKRRLPGFEGKWEKYRFEQLFQFLRNASNSRSELSQDGEVAYVHYGDIHTHESEFIVPSALQTFIGRDKVKNSARLLKGDLLMVDASEDTAAIGKAVEVLSVEEHEAVAGLHTMVLRGNKELLSDGFKGYLQHFPSVRSALVRLATGVSVYGITKSGVRAVEVAIPSVQEQAAIAEVLGSLQAEITALDSKLSKGRHLKQAMMQQLLTGKIRLV